tara:strand:- start:846 stop:1814 length:969 start_codon:yes stop_codon:yes gene_type:complete
MIKLENLILELLNEGGNVFGTTAPIAKEKIEPTLEKFTNQLGTIFPKKAATFSSFEKLGSAGKKDMSGDIDVAYPAAHLTKDGKPDLEGWGLNREEFDQLFEKIRKRARTSTETQTQMRAMLTLIANRINETNTEIRADAKSAGSNSLFLAFPQYSADGRKQPELIQVDINVGDPDWLKFSYYSNIYKGVVKGLHRTQLMLALFTAKGKMFKHEQGVLDKETREVEASTPSEAVELLNKLYGLSITRDQLNDYFELSEILERQLSEGDYGKVMDIYLKILDKTGPFAHVPENLEKYWIENQDRLGLTGKRLPEDSPLKKYAV